MRTTSSQDREFTEAVHGLIDLGDAIEWIISNFLPEDIYDEAVLNEWAEANGYVKKEEG